MIPPRHLAAKSLVVAAAIFLFAAGASLAQWSNNPAVNLPIAERAGGAA